MTETGSGVVYDGTSRSTVWRSDIAADEHQILLRAPMLLRCYRDGTVSARRRRLVPDRRPRTSSLPDGRLQVDGRRGDLIITGGENVWPEAVEAALADHPHVADVMVRGADDPEWGQIVEAVDRPRRAIHPPSTRLRAHVKEHHPAFMAPKRLTIVATLPRTAIGARRQADPAEISLVSRSARPQRQISVSGSGDAGASVDHVGLAGDPAREVAGEECGEVGDVLWVTQAPQRHPRRQLFPEVVDEERREIGLDETRERCPPRESGRVRRQVGGSCG
jgi:hypothetical protein